MIKTDIFSKPFDNPAFFINSYQRSGYTRTGSHHLNHGFELFPAFDIFR